VKTSYVLRRLFMFRGGARAGCDMLIFEDENMANRAAAEQKQILDQIMQCPVIMPDGTEETLSSVFGGLGIGGFGYAIETVGVQGLVEEPAGPRIVLPGPGHAH